MGLKSCDDMGGVQFDRSSRTPYVGPCTIHGVIVANIWRRQQSIALVLHPGNSNEPVVAVAPFGLLGWKRNTHPSKGKREISLSFSLFSLVPLPLRLDDRAYHNSVLPPRQTPRSLTYNLWLNTRRAIVLSGLVAVHSFSTCAVLSCVLFPP